MSRLPIPSRSRDGEGGQCNQTNQRFGYFVLDSQGEFFYSPSHKKQHLITNAPPKKARKNENSPGKSGMLSSMMYIHGQNTL